MTVLMNPYYHNVVCDLFLKRILKDIMVLFLLLLGRGVLQRRWEVGKRWCRVLFGS